MTQKFSPWQQPYLISLCTQVAMRSCCKLKPSSLLPQTLCLIVPMQKSVLINNARASEFRDRRVYRYRIENADTNPFGVSAGLNRGSFWVSVSDPVSIQRLVHFLGSGQNYCNSYQVNYQSVSDPKDIFLVSVSVEVSIRTNF